MAPLTTVTSGGILDGTIVNADVNASAAIALSKLSITGTGSNSNFLRGDGSWQAVPAGISLSGSTDNTIATVTGANALQGEANLTFDGSTLGVTGTVAASDISLAGTIFHTGDTDNKIEFDTDSIVLKTGNSNRLEANNYGVYVESGLPLAFLASSGDTPNIKSGGTNANDLLFTTGNAERLRIDSGGRFLIGHTASQSVYSVSALQIQGTDAATSSLSLLRQNGSPYLSLGATGGSTKGESDAVSSGDRLGQVTFVGADGTDVNTHSCSVSGYCDGTVSSNTVPGRLVFKTSTGAGESERLRINSAGNIMTGGLSEPLGFAYHSTSGTTLSIYDANANAGILELGGNPHLNAYNAGSIGFMNNNNSNGATPWNANSKFVHLVRAELVTSDNNAGDDSGADLVFYRKPEAGAGTEGFRIKSTGDVSLADGNLVVANGHGVDFSAQTATSRAGASTTHELLDHYEEGTWTPNMSVEGQSDVTLGTALGLYIRIGQTVHCWMDCQFSSEPTGRGTSNAWQWGGAPFLSQNDSGSPGGMRDYRFPVQPIDFDDNEAYGPAGNFLLRINDNGDSGRIEYMEDDGGLKNASLLITSGTFLQAYFCYPTDM